MALGEAERALADCAEALELEPGLAEAHRIRGTAYHQKGDPERALAELTEAIRRELPDTQVIALTSVLEDASVVGAVRAGAIGYLLKDTEANELLSAIRAAAAGQVRLSPGASARLMREVRAPASPETLTPREIEVLRLLAEGKANKEIARTLQIGDQTVKGHVSSVLGKLHMLSRTQAALYAARIGLISPEQVGRTAD
jgi:DNA-binding NarL/FixJ family response regulator